MNSLRARIAVLWAALALVCVLSAAALWHAHRSGPEQLIEAARKETIAACQGLQRSQQRLVAPDSQRDTVLLNVVVDLSLRDAIGVEGGIWEPGHGHVAYAFPTHEGAARKVDVPQAELPAIDALVARISASDPLLTDVRAGERETSVITACTLPAGRVAWTFERVQAAKALALQRLDALAAAGMAVVLGSGIWLLLALRAWQSKLHGVERALSESGGASHAIEPTGERDLDRLVDAFNRSSSRIAALSDQSQRLSLQLGRAERLASLGRVAAGMAHEIRNPLGSMRLRAENALAVDGEPALERRSAALTHILGSVQRVETLVESLLALTRPMRAERVKTELGTWLDEAVATRLPQADRQRVGLTAACPAGLTAEIDPVALARALDNLVLNALQHTPAGGRVKVSVESQDSSWRCAVEDSGPGVAPGLRDRLFEPFATSRSQGTGLGLAIAFEIVAAHGGQLRYVDTDKGARFEMDLPWLAS